MTFRRLMTLLAASTLIFTAARADEPDLQKTFQDLFPNLGQEQAQQKLQEICWAAAAPGHDAERNQVCTLMAAKLGAETPAPARVWLLKQLERIGREESVAAVAAVVADSDRLVRDAALRALANNPAPGAGDQLRAAFKTAQDDGLRLALINALGFRAEPASVEVLARGDYPNAKDPALPAAVYRALGKIGSPEAIALLKTALKESRGRARVEAGDALAKCARRLTANGHLAEARAIAELLYQPDEPARLAGLETLLRTSADASPETVLQVLARGDEHDSSVATGFIAGIDSKGVKQLADGLAALPSAAQVHLLAALGARRDRAALPAVTAAANTTDPAVKNAALAALGGVGDGSTVPLLVKAIQDGGDPANVARKSLETVFAEGVDQALLEALKTTTDQGRRALLIEILDNRRATAAVPALLDALTGADGNVRRKAISALGNVAGQEDISAMVHGLLKIHDAGDRDEAARAVASVCGRIADESKQAEPVLAVYRQAPAADQLALLPALGRIGGADTLVLVREAVAGSDDARRAAGQQALMNWPDQAVADDLATLAEKTSDPDLKRNAIHALARVTVLPGSLDNDARLALLTRGMKQAARNEEKRLLLDRAREIHTFASVRFAAEHIDDPKLASQAIATVVDLLHRDELRQNHPAETDKLLDRVIAISKDKSLIERAKSFKSAK